MQSPANLMAFGVSIGIVALSTVLLVTGRDILIPLAISVMIWYLLDALVRLFGRVRIASWRLPGWVNLPAALITIVVFLVVIGNMIGENIAQVIEQPGTPVKPSPGRSRPAPIGLEFRRRRDRHRR